MKEILKGMVLAIAVVAAAVVWTAIIMTGMTPKVQAPMAASTSFLPVEGTQFTVNSTVTASASTVSLSSFKTPDGRLLTMSDFGSVGYATLDPTDSTRLESISFTGITQNGDGSATLTGVSRGLDFITPYTASTTLAKIHLVGSHMILSNSSAFYGNEFLFANNNGTSSRFIVISSTSPWRYDAVGAQANGNYIATTSEFASVAYVNAVATSGAPVATQGVKGLVQISTAAQAASSTALAGGSTGATLVLPTSFATDTPQNCSSAGCIIMSLIGGKLNQAWLDLSAAFTWTGTHIFNGSVTTNGQVTLNATTTVNGIGINMFPISGFISGQTINKADAVVVATSTGLLVKANSALASTTLNFIGFATSTGATSSTIYVQTGGVVSGFSGLTAGRDYYINDSGALSLTPGSLELFVGQAVDSSSIFIKKDRDYQYIGSAAMTASGQSTTACNLDAKVSSSTRFVSVASTYSGNPAASAAYGTMARIGFTSFVGEPTNSSGVAASCSFTSATNAVSCTVSSSVQNSSWSCSGTVYSYR